MAHDKAYTFVAALLRRSKNRTATNLDHYAKRSVDVWWTEFGEYYPDWNVYTDFGRLPTRVAYEAAVARTKSSTTEVIPIVSNSIAWARSIPDSFLDWAYLDTSHSYEDTLAELNALAPKIKPDGLILGDDWHIDPEHRHRGVMLAVNDFIRQTEFDIRTAGQATQWLISRRGAG
jgi:Methyltransferase domain